MGGITGWVDWHHNLTSFPLAIENMTESLRARGPDGSGTWISPRCALGHRQLHVCDEELGAQPLTLTWQGHNYVIVYNGRLYNKKELSAELRSLGLPLHTRTDSEILLLAFIAWGEQCLERLNGMFAFAIWHREEQRLFMARDRLGIKPLFYRCDNDSLLFGSELKAILAHPDVRAEIGREGLAELFMISPARTPGHGIYKHMKELKPGCALLYDRSGVKLTTYWQLQSEPHSDSLVQTAERIHELLQDAVERQLQADVPVCTLLSGGLDSSAITAFAAASFARDHRGPLPTFSIDYVDNDKYFQQTEFQPNADAPWIIRVSQFLNTQHHAIVIDTAALVAALNKAMEARDLPGMADVDASLYLFFRDIKKQATVALSGEAADELFGGYPWFHRRTHDGQMFPWSQAIAARASLLSPELRQWLAPHQYVEKRYAEACAEVPHLQGESTHEARRRELFYLNLTRFAPTLLERKDRMSMAAGIEARLPFTDHRLIEYVWNIPWEIKRHGEREKGILRHALRHDLPEDVLYRKKSPYPKTHHPHYAQTVRDIVNEIRHDATSPLLPLIDVKRLDELLHADAQTYPLPWFGQLMTVPQVLAYFIQMNAWLKTYRVSIKD